MYSLVLQFLLFLVHPRSSSSLTIPTVNAPSRFNHNITVPSLGTLKINCFIQPPPPTTRLPKASIEDCYITLQYLLIGDKAMAPMHFSHDERRGFHVPFAWGHDSCQIIINNLEKKAEGTFQIVFLAHLAAEVIESCIMETTANLGGDIKVGSGSLFEVIVAGTGIKGGDRGLIGLNSSDAAVAKERSLTLVGEASSW